MRVLPVPFLANYPTTIFQNLVILGDSPSEVEWGSFISFGSTGLFVLWLIMTILRQVVLHQSTREISQDCQRYDIEWTRVKQHLESAAAIRDLEDMTRRFANASRDVRPMQVMCENTAYALQATHPCYMPRGMQQRRNGAAKAVHRMWNLLALPASSIAICSSLDTLYLQAYTLEPIFTQKVQQLSRAGDGKFVTRSGSFAGSEGAARFVTPEEWPLYGRAGLKPVDRAIEKLTRVYHGNVSMLLDVVRQCIVFESPRHLLKVMRSILDDSGLQVLRIKNRLSGTRAAGSVLQCVALCVAVCLAVCVAVCVAARLSVTRRPHYNGITETYLNATYPILRIDYVCQVRLQITVVYKYTVCSLPRRGCFFPPNVDSLRDLLCTVIIGLTLEEFLSDHYDARASGGYRDVLVNLRIKTGLTKQLGLENHVCELQLILSQFMVHRTLDGHKRYVAFRNKRCE